MQDNRYWELCFMSFYFRNRDEAEMDMLRRTFGIGFPLKLQMERKAVSQVHTILLYDPCSKGGGGGGKNI